MWIASVVLHPLQLYDLLAPFPLLILLKSELSKLLNLKYSKSDIITTYIKLPAEKRARLLDQYSKGPNLSRRNTLMKFQIKTAKFRGFIYFLNLFRINISLRSVKFWVSEETQVVAVFDHRCELQVIFIINNLITKHSCFFHFVFSSFWEERNVSENQVQRILNHTSWRVGKQWLIRSKVVNVFWWMCASLICEHVYPPDDSKQQELYVDRWGAQNTLIDYLCDAFEQFDIIPAKQLFIKLISIHSGFY